MGDLYMYMYKNTCQLVFVTRQFIYVNDIKITQLKCTN